MVYAPSAVALRQALRALFHRTMGVLDVDRGSRLEMSSPTATYLVRPNSLIVSVWASTHGIGMKLVGLVTPEAGTILIDVAKEYPPLIKGSFAASDDFAFRNSYPGCGPRRMLTHAWTGSDSHGWRRRAEGIGFGQFGRDASGRRRCSRQSVLCN